MTEYFIIEIKLVKLQTLVCSLTEVRQFSMTSKSRQPLDLNANTTL